jgi:hypothetical protein
MFLFLQLFEKSIIINRRLSGTSVHYDPFIYFFIHQLAAISVVVFLN